MWSVSLQDGFVNMLFDPNLLQPLRSTTHVPAVAMAQELVDNIAMIILIGNWLLIGVV